MFKIIVVCAFFAAAAAKPGALLYQAPITQYSTFIEPATTTLLKHQTSVINPTSIEYYTPALAYSHLIKKRSAQWVSPAFVPIPEAYKPLYHSQYILPTVPATIPQPIQPVLHLIKKRSAVPAALFAPTTYAAPAAPILTTSYAAAAPLIPTGQLIPTAPLIAHPITGHLIKKRSAAHIPTVYSHQSRFDLQGNPLIPTSYAGPINYALPYGYPYVY